MEKTIKTACQLWMESIIGIYLLSSVFILSMISCGGSDNQNRPDQSAQEAPPVLEVIAADYAFQAPDSIPSGWTTLRLKNQQGMEIHELGLAKLPEGKGLNDYMNEVMPAWETALLQMQNGDIEASEMVNVAVQQLPEWNSNIQYVKSRGLISPGLQTDNIMYLEPGTYLIECWVKNADGQIHISNGMIRQLTVTADENGVSVPEAGYQISLAADEIVTDEPIGSGEHLISVDFETDDNGQIIHGNVHLIRVENETDLAQVADWLGWYSIGGLRAPAPAEFLGGIDTYGSLPYGEKGYFSADIEPGNYAWIVNAPADEELWEEFTVE